MAIDGDDNLVIGQSQFFCGMHDDALVGLMANERINFVGLHAIGIQCFPCNIFKCFHRELVYGATFHGKHGAATDLAVFDRAWRAKRFAITPIGVQMRREYARNI